LYSGDYENALKVFHLNIEQNPEAWNPYDSLGEGYFLSGDLKNALKYYKKSVELNTENQSNNNNRIQHIIHRIEKKAKQK